MIYKLQNAGSLPRWMQKLNSWSIPDSDESAGERILNSTIAQANDTSTQEKRDQIYKDSAKKNLAVTGQSLMMLPMSGEFTAYGLLGGGLRLGAGMAGSKAGEYVLGKGGDWADKKLNTKFLGTTGRILGGLGGWWGGSSATTPLFRTLAGKGITLHMPQETFANLRNQYFTNAGNKAMAKATPDIVQTNIEAGKLGWAPSSKQTLWHNSEQPLTRLKIDFPAWDVTERGAPLGHTWLTGTETTEGFLGARPYHLKGNIQLSKPMIQIGEAIENGKNNTRNQILDFAQKSSADAINFKGISDNTLQNQDVYSVFKNVDLNDNLKLEDILRTRGSAQEAATTYHYDPRVNVLSRPISSAERKGIIKHERPMYDPEVLEKAKLFAEEYGYPEPKTPEEIKNMYRRHNTFFTEIPISPDNWVKQRLQYQSPTTTVWTETPKRGFDPTDRFIAGQDLVESLQKGNVPSIDAHGIAKGAELENLENILQHGIDWNRRFDTAPLFKTKGSEGIGSGLGTATGTAYNDGQFILTSKPNTTLKNGIDAVLINDADPGYARFLKQALQEKYPNFRFMTYGEAPNYYGVKKLSIPTWEQTTVPTMESVPQSTNGFELPPPPEEVNIVF